MGAGKSYGAAERLFAKWLDRFPRVRGFAKKVYQRANYLVFRNRNLRCLLHPGARMLTPMHWAGVDDLIDEWFFGYYDKAPWSPDMRYSLFHRPTGDRVEIFLIDRQRQEMRMLAAACPWNAQQGSQAQWVRGTTADTIVFNDVVDGYLGCRMLSLDGQIDQFVPWPVQTLHPNGHEFLSLNYKRLYNIRPEYGYSVKVSNFAGAEPLDRDGIWRVDMESGQAGLVLSLDALASHERRPEMSGALHKVNHIIYSPSGSRFVFMHRWITGEGKFSRLYVAKADGNGLRLLMDERMVSHYQWRDDDHLLVWGRTAEAGDHYYLVNADTGEHEIMGEGVLDVWGDGHPSFSPDKVWVATDTYPDRARLRHLLIFNTKTQACIEVGQFLAPWAFDGAERCDLHPRWSPDGRWISIDSAHEGLRRSYFIDVGDICSEQRTANG